MVLISLIAAVSENGVIGKDNDMPWHISSDLKYFKKVTQGKPVIMGRKTFQSIGKPLAGRTNIVITRDTSYAPEGVIIAFTIDMALEIAVNMAQASGGNEVMVIGGAQIYALTINKADRLYFTRVHGEMEGDAFFPEIIEDDWLELSAEHHKAGAKDSHDYSFIVLDRF